MNIVLELRKNNKTWQIDSLSPDLSFTVKGYPSRNECMVDAIDHIIRHFENVTIIVIKWHRQKIFPSQEYQLTTTIKLLNNNSVRFRSVTSILETEDTVRIRDKGLGDNVKELVGIIDTEALCLIN